MKGRILWIVALGLGALLVVGGLHATNMAFKIEYPLIGDPNGPTLNPPSGQNSIALPYNAQMGIFDAGDLLDDLNLASGTPTAPFNVLQVAQWRRDLDGFVGYTGTSGAPFPLIPGEAYLTQVKSDVTYTIVGTHDPGLQVDFTGDPNGPSLNPPSGQNYYSYPYHSTAGNAEELLDEVVAHAGAPVVLQVAQWRKNLDGFVGYTGTSGAAFDLVPGEGYLIQVTVDVAGFVPSHF